jgi:hypothetical protein
MARMSELLEEALPLDAAARRIWLEHLSPEHGDLSAALRRSLLPDDVESAQADALQRLPVFGAGTLQPGTRLGPYELLRSLGAGGMAEVWLARRADGAFKRDVALKVPMLAQLRSDLEQRFARERDIVASLEHPNIARLYDAGVDEGGLPYLSMEYVQGRPAQRSTAIRTNLAGCAAIGVASASPRGGAVRASDGASFIATSSLRTSLVMEPGQVRLLDFGVANALGCRRPRTKSRSLAFMDEH